MKKALTGFKPQSGSMQRALVTLIPKREPSEIIVVHHWTDMPKKLQLEIERRSKVLGLSFERIIVE